MESLFKFFIKRWRVSYLLIASSIIFGTISMFSLPQEADPEVKVPFASVLVIYPGASPENMENLVVKELEDKIDTLDNLKKTTSSSSFGVASLFVEFEANADIDKSIRDLKDKVDETKSALPEDAEDPIVTEISLSDFPIITFSISSGKLSQEELFNLSDDVKSELESVSGVQKVVVLGKRDKEIEILIDKDKLASLGISLGQVAQKIQSNHLDFPIGEVLSDDINISLRLSGKFLGAEDLKKMPIITTNQGSVILGDIAKVREVLNQETSLAFFSLKGSDINQTISFQVYKKTGGNIVQISDNAKKIIDEMGLPEGVDIEVSNDNSQFIRDDLSKLTSNGIQTIIIVFFLIWLALGFREAIIAGFSIPLVFLLTFATIKMEGGTLNSMSLFALVLSLGLIVDTTIVITEGIFDNIRFKKMSSEKASLESVKTFASPIISGTLTTVSAFLPMLLVSGIMGEYMSVLPMTIAPTLLWSLVVALFFVPAVAAKIFKNVKIKDFKETPFMHSARAALTKFLKSLLESRKKRIGLITGAFMTFFFAIFLAISGAIPIEMFPSFNADYFNVSVEMPEGTKLEDTYQESLPVVDILNNNENVENFTFAVGSGALARTGSRADTSGGGSTSSNQASFTVNLQDKDNREKTSYQIAEEIRKEINKIDTIGEISIDELTAGPPSGKPMEIRIYGEDIREMESVARGVEGIMKNMDGVIEISNSIAHSAGEFVFSLRRDQIDFYGLTPSMIAQEMRLSVFGLEIGEIARNEDDIKINLSIDWENSDEKPHSVEDIKNLRINTSRGQVALGDLVDVSLEQGFSQIEHQDMEKIIRVQASVLSGVNVSDKMKELENLTSENISIPNNISVEFGGSTEDIDQSFTEIFQSMIVAVILIAFILILQFQSFAQPFIILLTLPLALIGVLGGFFLLQWSISFPAFIGIVSLSGIVINDAIVLIDRINKNRKRGMEIKEAILESGGARMKPIFLTSTTTVFGILPLALSDEIWGGLGFAIIFGLIFSTFLTLIIVPNLYYMLSSSDPEKSSEIE